MLNSCGHALIQEAGNDFHPRCNWEATPPGYSACVRAWRWLAPCHGVSPAQTYCGSPEKLEEQGMLAGVTDCRTSWKWGCRERLALGFKPRCSSHDRGGPRSFCGVGTLRLGQQSGPCGFGLHLLPRGLGSRRDFAGKIRGERTLAGGPWEGATWLWINWRSWWRHSWWCQEPEPWTSTSFPEVRYPGLGRGRRKDCVHLWEF